MIAGLGAKAMGDAELGGALSLLRAFLAADTHYRDSAEAYGDRGPDALDHALRLFLAHPELGFVWLALDAGTVVGGCVVCYAISTSAGAIVAKLDDVCVLPGREGQGIGTVLIDSLKDVRLGFRTLNEERLALVL